MKKIIFTFIALVSFLTACQRIAPEDLSICEEKIRTVMLTDMIPDDGNSLLRYLYNSSWFDQEAMII